MFEFDYYLPTQLVVGNGKLNELGELARDMGSKAFLVTGKRSMKEAGVTDRVVKNLESVGIEVNVFAEAETNPSREMANRGARIAKQAGADIIIGLGGGSAMDTAKGIAVVVSHGGDIWDYVEGERVPPSPTLPIIALPSTAGTGSEVTQYAVFSNQEVHVKQGFGSDYIIPRLAIIDGELMSYAPSGLTAKAGGDAFAQAVEAYLSKLAHPCSDFFAEESIRLCSRYLRKAVKKGDDLESRAAMGWASSLAGIAINLVDVVIGHNVSEIVGALFETHHGETAAVLLAPTMEFNLQDSAERIARIAELMGEDISGLDVKEAARLAVDKVKELLSDIGIPMKLKDIGVTTEAVPQMLEMLEVRVPDMEAGNPREISKESLQEFFELAM